tara:strand:+ start:599 stop:844 length:246 start_codon:yes stop_codon:yes gene_type:complete
MAYGTRLVINCTTGEETREDVLVNPEQRTTAQIATDEWKSDMSEFRLSREVEDLITEGSLSMNAYQKTIYDAKVQRRSEKP